MPDATRADLTLDHNVRVKLANAGRALNDLKLEITRYQGIGGFRLIVEDRNGQRGLRAARRDDLDDTFVGRIGDVLNNLRTCLEYATGNLVRPHIPEQFHKKIQFPLAATEEKFEGALKSRKMDQIPSVAIAAIKELQPFSTSNDTLKFLIETNNFDKHHGLIAIDLSVALKQFDLGTLEPSLGISISGITIVGVDYLFVYPVSVAQKTCRTTQKFPDKHFPNRVDSALVFRAKPFESKPVIPTLEEVYQATVQAVTVLRSAA